MDCGLEQEVHFDDLLQDDETALHCAAARGHVECVQSLLDAGAPVDTADQVCHDQTFSYPRCNVWERR